MSVFIHTCMLIIPTEEKGTDAQCDEVEEEARRDARDEREQTEVSRGGRGGVREELRVKFSEMIKEVGEGERQEKLGSYTKLSQLNILGEQENTNADNQPSRGSFSSASDGSNDYVNKAPGYDNSDRWIDEYHTQSQSSAGVQRSENGVDDYVHMSSVHEPQRVKVLNKSRTVSSQQKTAAGAGRPSHSMEKSVVDHHKPYQEWAAKSNSRFKGPTVPPSVSRATAAVPYTAQDFNSYKNVHIGNLPAYLNAQHSKLAGISASTEMHKFEHVREQESGNMAQAPTTEGTKKRTYVNIDGSLLPPEPYIKPRKNST